MKNKMKHMVMLMAGFMSAVGVMTGCGTGRSFGASGSQTVYEDVLTRQNAVSDAALSDRDANQNGGTGIDGAAGNESDSGNPAGKGSGEPGENAAAGDEHPSGEPRENADGGDEDGSGEAEQTILVYVCGAVEHSGVVELPEGARVYQALEAAGGLTEDADDRQLNQAMVLADGDQITVLTKEEAGEMPLSVLANGTEKQASGSDGKININTADAEELQKLNGVGASRAADIIAYREANGSFHSIEEIMKVSGIKTALFNRIKDQITVG